MDDLERNSVRLLPRIFSSESNRGFSRQPDGGNFVRRLNQHPVPALPPIVSQSI